MDFYSKCPTGPIGNFVERFWQINDSPSHIKERIMPSGTMEMVFNLREDEFRIYRPIQLERCRRFSGAIVSGTYKSSFVIDARQHDSVVGVHFRVGGAFPFLGVAANDLADTHVDLETFWGSAAAELRERLCSARHPAERFRLLENALITHLFRPMEHHNAVRLALDTFMRADADSTVRDVAKAVGLSQRRFIQVFAREVGLTPKLFCRMRRFQRAVSKLGHAQVPDWANLVIECGYFDQSHLINDFRDFSGLPPTEYLSQRNARVMDNHVPLPGR